MAELKASGVKILAPPIYLMLALNDKGEIVPRIRQGRKAAGLDLIGWSLERDGPLNKGGGFYHRSVKAAIDRDGDTLTVLDVLAKQVGVRAMFSDWPATTTFMRAAWDEVRGWPRGRLFRKAHAAKLDAD